MGGKGSLDDEPALLVRGFALYVDDPKILKTTHRAKKTQRIGSQRRQLNRLQRHKFKRLIGLPANLRFTIV